MSKQNIMCVGHTVKISTRSDG